MTHHGAEMIPWSHHLGWPAIWINDLTVSQSLPVSDELAAASFVLPVARLLVTGTSVGPFGGVLMAELTPIGTRPTGLVTPVDG
jgi:hypothetical protein